MRPATAPTSTPVRNCRDDNGHTKAKAAILRRMQSMPAIAFTVADLCEHTGLSLVYTYKMLKQLQREGVATSRPMTHPGGHHLTVMVWHLTPLRLAELRNRRGGHAQG